ncbi:MAG: helix-turn-helix domain-containing protein, partial [Clostridiales bacterium]|nr:helix-turn-helix domain-containing protein [Clostridiales bacterium]
PDVPALLLSGDEWLISDEISGRLHFHDCTEIGFCHSGEGALLFEGGEKLAFAPGDVTIIPRYVPHTTYSRKGSRSHWSYIFLNFTELAGAAGYGLVWEPDGCESEDWGRDSAENYLFTPENSRRVHFEANCLLDELRRKDKNWEQAIKATAFIMRNELHRLFENDKRPRDGKPARFFTLKPALEFIRSSYMNRITIKELSDMCYISENHFRRLFLSTMGDSPLNFINAARITRACELLNTTNMPISAISNAVGMSSFSNFNRNFKAFTGMSPRGYRAEKSKGDFDRRQKYVLTYQGWLAPEEHPEQVADPDDGDILSTKNG